MGVNFMKAITNLVQCVSLKDGLPDAFLFAIILTIVVFIAAMVGTGVGPLRVLSYWGSDSGFWGLLGIYHADAWSLCWFCSGAGACSEPVAEKVCRSGSHAKQGILVTVIVSGICMWLN